MKIAINPGHFDSLDSGAVGQNGTHEANVVFQIAQRLQQRLNDESYQTVFISSNELQKICDIANAEQADYFISIHANACDNPDVQGAETWYMSDTGKELAKRGHGLVFGGGSHGMMGALAEGAFEEKGYILEDKQN